MLLYLPEFHTFDTVNLVSDLIERTTKFRSFKTQELSGRRMIPVATLPDYLTLIWIKIIKCLEMDVAEANHIFMHSNIAKKLASLDVI